jgi:hypothetical protein
VEIEALGDPETHMKEGDEHFAVFVVEGAEGEDANCLLKAEDERGTEGEGEKMRTWQASRV